MTSIPSLNHLFVADYKNWSRTVSPERAYNVRSYWKKHASPEFGALPINCHSPETALSFFLSLPVGWDVRNVLLQTCRKLEKQALRRDYLRRPIFADVKLPKARKSTRVKFFRPDEIRDIFAACDAEQRVAFGLMYFAGLRLSEVKRLEWKDIDFEGGELLLRDTKNGDTVSIPLLPELARILTDWTSHAELVLPSSKTGREYNRSHAFGIDDLLASAGVEKAERACHAFRHSAAVHAASGDWGEPWSRDEVSELLRNPSAIDVYFKIAMTHMRKKANGVDLSLVLGELRAHVETSNDIPASVVRAEGELTSEASLEWRPTGAGEEIRTLDLDLGKVALYH